MSDWSDLFQSDSFRAYRRKQSETIASIIDGDIQQAIWGNPEVMQTLKGKLSVMQVMLKIPERLTNDEGLKEILRRQLEEDLGNITTYLMREALRD